MTIFDKLPERIKYKGNYYFVELWKNAHIWNCHYAPVFGTEDNIFVEASSSIEKAAEQTYNQLKKENLINPL